MPTLEVRGLKKSIDGHGVLKDVSFGLQDGELAAILGPSGGVKTTLFRARRALAERLGEQDLEEASDRAGH